MTEDLARALATLTGDQLYVIAGFYWEGLNETQIAVELTSSRGQAITRDRIHRIHRTALDRMRRALRTPGQVAA